MLRLFECLNHKLAEHQQIGELGLVGGAVMCLVYNARSATKDVNAIFEPTALIRNLVQQIAREEGLPEDWLNDAAKGFIQPHFLKETVLNLSHLRVWAPDARYMLAMKCISARWDTSDGDDVRFLIQHLQLHSPQEVFAIIEHYYPQKQIPAKTQFFIEEIFAVSN